MIHLHSGWQLNATFPFLQITNMKVPEVFGNWVSTLQIVTRALQ